MTSYEKVVEAPAFPKPSAGPDLLGTLGPSDNDTGGKLILMLMNESSRLWV